MSDDKIAEIRERYAGYSLNSGNAGKANEDRGWLLAEVDRRGAEIERLRADNERMHNVLYRIARKRPFVHNPWALARAALEGEP